jgi:hypothetical protein
MLNGAISSESTIYQPYVSQGLVDANFLLASMTHLRSVSTLLLCTAAYLGIRDIKGTLILITKMSVHQGYEAKTESQNWPSESNYLLP